MASTSEQQWLQQARALVLRGDFAQVEPLLKVALEEHPRSFELRRVLAGVYRQIHRYDEAEALLRELSRESPQDAGTAFTLAELLIGQARTQAAGQVLRSCFDGGQHDPNLAIRAIELLDEADRKLDAAAIADNAIAAVPDDPRLHAYAGMLQLQLGAFERARKHHLFALEHSPKACEWHVPHGLASAQRYADAGHPDFERFRACLQRTDLSDKARASLLFALGKAHDDIGDYRNAALYFRQANAIANSLTDWSRKDWRRMVSARLATNPVTRPCLPGSGFIPIFIVGMPRSGTTLLAELLSRHAGVCNRGELPWIGRLAQQPDLSGDPSTEALTRAAAVYTAQARRDDGADARWFVDKQPLNFRYLDLVLALFPNARIIHCIRNARDTALSLWAQSFSEDVQGYAYHFDHIAVVMRDCERLMQHWRRCFPHSIRAVHYEELVAAPEATMAALATWAGLPDAATTRAESPSISTASLWQARQPVYARSLRRWQAYVEYVPKLLEFKDH
jgi:tetratricopeptide (TPR) repeat protein